MGLWVRGDISPSEILHLVRLAPFYSPLGISNQPAEIPTVFRWALGHDKKKKGKRDWGKIEDLNLGMLQNKITCVGKEGTEALSLAVTSTVKQMSCMSIPSFGVS